MVPIYSDITDNINGQTVCTSHDQSSEVADMRSDGLLQVYQYMGNENLFFSINTYTYVCMHVHADLAESIKLVY